ncbi:MAG: flavin reductase family protein [Sphingobacteriaceae bacterium]|nr:MAG: flavin reductase family protein [Sphingobacteriaceae bacterium]
MKTLIAGQLSPNELYSYLTYAVAPRPICFASTINLKGEVNLSPFSFFNMMSSNPPVCVFSVARWGHDNTTKDTLNNVLKVPECVINVVNYEMVQQMSLASAPYDAAVNEFLKAGFTEQQSELVKPPRVAEAPVQIECLVQKVIPLGDQGGAGSLIICDVKLVHIREEILDENGKIDQQKIDLVARLGGDWYCRVTPESLFIVPRPGKGTVIGIDGLPAAIKNSAVLTGNDLGKLGNITDLPDENSVAEFAQKSAIKNLLDATIGDNFTRERELHREAKKRLDEGKTEDAWKILLLSLQE